MREIFVSDTLATGGVCVCVREKGREWEREEESGDMLLCIVYGSVNAGVGINDIDNNNSKNISHVLYACTHVLGICN